MLQNGYYNIVIWTFDLIFITHLLASFCLGNILKQKTDKLLINANKTVETLEIQLFP